MQAKVTIAGFFNSGVDLLPTQLRHIAVYLTKMAYHAVKKGIDVQHWMQFCIASRR